ncbi:MAG: carboxypeptidase regulatory-like domain-containing protein, partial [Planctomycetales bacterium]|nr:carboxypeptidase regulatory-like domain-containing protein [Planctomycetales bacterium]
MASRIERTQPRNHRNGHATANARANVCGVEPMEQRIVLSIQPVLVGSVYIEEDLGSDLHGDTFVLTFKGGAPNTQLKYIEIDGDQNTPGFDVGDVFFDTQRAANSFGADDAIGFQVVKATGMDVANITPTVTDGTTKLRIDFAGFDPGDRLVFTIDVDEVEDYDPNETDITTINDGFDPITSGVEFQGSTFKAYFAAPNFEDAVATSEFVNRYDPILQGTGLDLPADDEGGKRDRSTGTVATVTQAVIPVTLSGHVYHDRNMNQRFDAGEEGLRGVELQAIPIETAVDQTIQVTHTDADGSYSFSGLSPGSYRIVETQPDGYIDWFDQAGTVDGVASGNAVNPGDAIDQIVLPGGSAGIDYDFGEILPVSISGRVQLATPDGDCFSDTIEHAPVANALVQLLDEQGNVVDETRSASDGSYSFNDLTPGNYRVREFTPDGLFDGGARAGNVNGSERGIVVNAGEVAKLDLLSGERVTRVDFCELEPVSIRGNVHLATVDGDCFTDDVYHVPLAGVTIRLLDDEGNQVAETTTDDQGDYEFVGLEPGVYTIVELTPPGYFEGGAMVGLIDGGGDFESQVLDASTIGYVTLGPGQDATNYEFCEFAPSDLSGYVYHDRNNDGQQDVGEEGIADVALVLTDDTGAIVATASTDATGRYEFRELKSGLYTIEEVQPFGWIDGIDTPGTIDGKIVGVLAPPNDTISQITLGWGQTGIEYNFGELKATSISGNVHLSTIDGDCFTDTIEHENLPNVTIQLLDVDGQIIDETTTDTAGNYYFFDLLPGTYGVREFTPDGYLEAGARAGHVDNKTVGRVIDPNHVLDIVLGSGDAAEDVDFCEHRPSSLSGYVYADTDDDGIRDTNELGIEDVEVILYGSNGNEIARTLTDAVGAYRFDNLVSDNYRIVERWRTGNGDPALEWLDGKDAAGTVSGQVRGEATNPGDEIHSIHVGWGEDGIEYNFGEINPASISGIVHTDLDQDCVFEPENGEIPLAGVTVELLNANGDIVQSMVTDGSGRFEFRALLPGSYTLREIQPADYFDGGQLAGTAGGSVETANEIRDIQLSAGVVAEDYRFCEEPPSEVSGYVFKDGETIRLSFGESLPDDISTIRDGRLTDDDLRLGGVVLELRDGTTGARIYGEDVPQGDNSGALPGLYPAGPIRTTTDANGFYRFAGLHRGSYAVYEVQPDNYIDSIDSSPGPGIAVNRHDYQNNPIRTMADAMEDHHFDAIIQIELPPGYFAPDNNFSEIQTQQDIIPWLQRPAPPRPEELPAAPTEILAALPPRELTPLNYQPTPFGRFRGVWANTWHLSVLDGGSPRGEGVVVQDRGPIWFDHEETFFVGWQNDDVRQLHWVLFVDGKLYRERLFGIQDGIVIAGDFNGDGLDEIGIFHEGQWFIDVNGNGKWDSSDMWVKLGHQGDQPVVGDWNGDGKDDVGTFGLAWPGDRRAIHRDPGLPDLENRRQGEEKNLPPAESEAAQERRELRLTAEGDTRSDVIDHVFHYGTHGDKAVSGDWNGDGITNV